MKMKDVRLLMDEQRWEHEFEFYQDTFPGKCRNTADKISCLLILWHSILIIVQP